MPVVKSPYQPPFLLRNYHVSTIYASLLRTVEVDQQRERLELPDSDFIDIDWSFSKKGKSSSVLVTMHGLEGSADRPYMKGVSRYFTDKGWDVAAVNMRGCSGELNRKFRSYHAGATQDLAETIQHILSKNQYNTIALNGFSLGANLMLKYLGEEREIPKQVKAAVMVSVPCDLYGSLQKLQEKRNLLYEKRFMRKLKEHLLRRAENFPQELTKEEINACTSLKEIDDMYTSRAHDFENALDYYEKNSSLQFLSDIKIPSLILNARNDGFLSSECYPVEVAEKNPNLYLEMPEYGGHVSFLQEGDISYSEERAFQFIEAVLSGNLVYEKADFRKNSYLH